MALAGRVRRVGTAGTDELGVVLLNSRLVLPQFGLKLWFVWWEAGLDLDLHLGHLRRAAATGQCRALRGIRNTA